VTHPTVAISCPNGCDDSLGSRGWVQYPRIVILEDRSAYLFVKRYSCSVCKRWFAASNSKILKQLPFELASRFPVFLTHRSGIDKSIVQLLNAGIAGGFGISQVQAYITERHTLRCFLIMGLVFIFNRFTEMMRSYYSILQTVKNEQRSRSALGINELNLITKSHEIQLFKTDFKDPKGYFGRVPSSEMFYFSLIKRF
jgi:hypothetical protein